MLFGYTSFFTKLARRLDSDHPFYTFFLDYPKEANAETLTIERIAEHFLRDIRSLQPRGPYYLGGWSLGGLVAYEMARQIRAQGEAVELLALLDTTGPGYPQKRPWREQVPLHFQQLRRLGLMRGCAYVLGTLWELAQPYIMTVRQVVAERRGRSHPWTRVNRIGSTYLATIKPYSESIVLFVATGTLAETADQVAICCDPRLCWGSVVQGTITTHLIPGTHITMFDEPGLSELAIQLAAHLDKRPIDSRLSRKSEIRMSKSETISKSEAENNR